MKLNKSFLAITFLGLGAFASAMLMKTLHLQGAQVVLIISDCLLILGLMGLGVSLLRSK